MNSTMGLAGEVVQGTPGDSSEAEREDRQIWRVAGSHMLGAVYR